MSSSRVVAPALAVVIGVVSGIWVFDPLIRSSLKPEYSLVVLTRCTSDALRSKPPIMESAVREYEYSKSSIPAMPQATVPEPATQVSIEKEAAQSRKQI